MKNIGILSTVQLPEAVVAQWHAANPAKPTGDLAEDSLRYADFWRLCATLIHQLPTKPKRDSLQAEAAGLIHEEARAARQQFLNEHAGAVYARLTQNYSRFIRLDNLVAAAAEEFPGLVPNAEQLAIEQGLRQGDKDGLEIDQGLFLSHILGHEKAGTHLCHAMLLAREDSRDHVAKFTRDGALDLGAVLLTRRGNAAFVETTNARYLNAEDQTTIDAMEIAVDAAILDPKTTIAVLRGGAVAHPKYSGRRVFGSGINLTHLYQGKIPFLWFLQRELGFVHKFMRGVARPEMVPDDVQGYGTEKPWISVIESFAIGGHCQILLTQDYVLAANDAFMTLPARKEGIIPGFSNMRLPRFTGDRLARQLIQYERKLACESPEGRLVCDEIVAPEQMDHAIERVVQGLTSSGAVGAIGNRRAFRVAEEPLDLFRRYAAVYSREQACCHFSPALIANLERHWDAQNRKA